MSRKHKHPEHVNHERWLVSYADFITLLFAFFVVLFSSSQVDRSKTNKMALAIEAAFSRFSLFKTEAGEANFLSAEGKVASHSSSQLTVEDGTPIYMATEIIEMDEGQVAKNLGDAELSQGIGQSTSPEVVMARVHQTLLQVLEKNKLADSVLVSEQDRGLVISVRNAVVFQAGADQIAEPSRQLLHGIGGVLAGVKNQIRIEGHTDDQAPDAGYASNWDLSAARASTVAKWLLADYAIDPARISVVGYGQYRPIAENTSDAGRVQNRRVDIVVLSNEAAKKESPIPVNPDDEKNPHYRFDMHENGGQ